MVKLHEICVKYKRRHSAIWKGGGGQFDENQYVQITIYLVTIYFNIRVHCIIERFAVLV